MDKKELDIKKISGRLLATREKLDYAGRKQKEFAKFLGINYTTYRKYEEGKIKGLGDKFLSFLEFFSEKTGEPLDWLLYGKWETVEIKHKKHDIQGKFFKIPVITTMEGPQTMPNTYLYAPLDNIFGQIEGHFYFAIHIDKERTGMEPTIIKDDLVIIDNTVSDLQKGKIYYILINDEYKFRYLSYDNQMKRYNVISKDPSMGLEYLTPDQEPHAIAGEVVWIARRVS